MNFPTYVPKRRMKTKLDLIRDSKYLAKEAYLFIVSNDNMFNLIADKVL